MNKTKLNEKLKKRMKKWDKKELNYKSNTLPEILKYNYLYRKDKGYPYNNSIFEFILENEQIDDNEELKKHLKLEVYLSQKQIDRIEKAELEKKMLSLGFVKLTEEIVKRAYKKKKKIQLNANSTNDWMTIKVNKILKPWILNDGRCGLLPLRARSRGYSLSQFNNDAYCKIID